MIVWKVINSCLSRTSRSVPPAMRTASAGGRSLSKSMASDTARTGIKEASFTFRFLGDHQIYSIDYFIIACTSAHDPFDSFFDLFLIGLSVFFQKGVDRHDHAQCTITALNGSCFCVGLLDRMEPISFRKPFDCQNLSSLRLQGQGQAAIDTLSVKDHRTVATLTLPA